MKPIFIFVGGAIAGAGATYLFGRNYIRKQVQSEIDHVTQELEKCRKEMSVKNHVDNLKEVHAQKEAAKISANKPDIATVSAEKVRKNYAKTFEPENKIQETWKPPYIIDETEFVDSEFNCVSLTYYGPDRVLADDKDDPMDIEDTIGDEALIQLLERDDDVIYVRNEKYCVDYEVILSEKDYEGDLDEDEER